MHVGGIADNNTAEDENERRGAEWIYQASEQQKLQTVAGHYDCDPDIRPDIIFGARTYR